MYLKKSFLSLLIVCFGAFMSPHPSYAQVAAALKIGQAIGGMISTKAISKGASQAAAAATNGAVGNALAAVVGVGSAAMLWSAVGGPIGIGAGIALAAQSLYTLMTDGTASSPPDYAPAITQGQLVYCFYESPCFPSVSALFTHLTNLSNQQAAEAGQVERLKLDECVSNGCYQSYVGQPDRRLFNTYTRSYIASISCPSGRALNGNSCVLPLGTSVAGSSLPAAELSKPVNPSLLADYANKSWQRAAAASGYSGVPYDASNPITASDAAAWVAANPSSAPTVGDLFQPVPLTSGGAVPIAAPTAATGDTTAPTDPATNPPFVMPCGIAGMPACNVTLSDPIATSQSVQLPDPSNSDRPDPLPFIKNLLPTIPALSLPTFLTGIACHPINVSYTIWNKQFNQSWDFCKFINFFKDVLSWMAYVFTCFVLYGLAIRPRGSAPADPFRNV